MYLVAGLGKTGVSVLEYLQMTDEAALAFDTRESFDCQALEQRFPKVLFATGALPKKWLKKISTLVLSPGISSREAWVQDLIARGVQVIGDIELFARAVGVPVIAITGSNGKSTVTTLVGMALQEAGYSVGVGGNIGRPALELLMADQEYEIFVLELSSFQLETTYSLHTISSALLNLSEDHMDRYDDMNAYLQAKLNIFNDTQLAVCPDDLNCENLGSTQRRLFGIGLSANFAHYTTLSTPQGLYLGRGQMPMVSVDAMRLSGKHHQLNALAMMALCEPLRISPDVYQAVLAKFSGLAHRTQEVANVDGVRWINDSKGTNVGATVTAIESMGEQVDGKVVLLAGGVGKDAEFSALTPAVKAYCSKVILFGEDREQLAQVMPTDSVLFVDTLYDAVKQAKQFVTAGDVVLFSPACASFDQFKNFEHRGECFMDWVQQQVIQAK